MKVFSVRSAEGCASLDLVERVDDIYVRNPGSLPARWVGRLPKPDLAMPVWSCVVGVRPGVFDELGHALSASEPAVAVVGGTELPAAYFPQSEIRDEQRSIGRDWHRRWALRPEAVEPGVLYRSDVRGLVLVEDDERSELRRRFEESELRGLSFTLLDDEATFEAQDALAAELMRVVAANPWIRREELKAVIAPGDLWLFNKSWQLCRDQLEVPHGGHLHDRVAIVGTPQPPPAPPRVQDPRLRRGAPLRDILDALGCPDPEGWAESQRRDRLARVAMMALLGRVRIALDEWRRPDVTAGLDDQGKAAAARLLAGGGSDEDLSTFAFAVAEAATFDLFAILDSEGDSELPGFVPGWELVEIDSETGRRTGRTLSGIHEELNMVLAELRAMNPERKATEDPPGAPGGTTEQRAR